MTNTTQIFESFTADFTAKIEYTEAHGQWWKRVQERGPQGYRWSAWRPSAAPSNASPTTRLVRIHAPDAAPKAAPRTTKRPYFVAGPAAAGEHYYVVTAYSGAYMGRINAVSSEQACQRACQQNGYTYYSPASCTALECAG